jgi:zinc transport system permease protein|tara:strand:- start:4301 stop:5104 length:804 start_codon:yes stop_codon:yes gene_type:complete
MLDDFMIRASLGGIGVALAAAPLGCFIVWRRMAYFGEATAHAALLGIALSLTFEFSVFLGAILVALIMASLVTLYEGRSLFLDTLLGVAGHSAIAAGLVIVSFISGIRIDLMAYLIGDILAVSRLDLILIWAGAGIILSLIIWRWSPLLLVTLNEDLAAANGFNPKKESFILTVSLAIVVAVGIKVVGVLLIIAMLIIPAASARTISSTPEAMGIVASLIGVSSAILGLNAAYIFDTPTGPSIVCVASTFFLISILIRAFFNSRNNF